MNLVLFTPEQERLYRRFDELFVPAADKRAGHIINVLKLKQGDTLRCGTVGSGHYCLMRVLDISPDGVTLGPTGEEFPSPEPNPVTLILGQVRPICVKRILRDVTALGVGKLVLTLGENCEKSYASATIYTSGEYLDVLLDGAMQAMTTYIPQTVFARDVRQAIELTRDASGDRILLDNVVGSHRLARSRIGEGECVMAIGPERGWTDNERSLFIDAGFAPMLIGQRVLRTETAVPVALGILLSRTGRM